MTNYSIGEEISASAPIALSWSPPGLAKHRRSALAALTANLVLSIWSSDGQPKDESSWRRNLIINNALADYFLVNAPEDPSHVEESTGERVRLRSRVRAFAWAPAFSNSDAYAMGTSLSYGPHLVVVCNDDNQLVLVLIESPASTFGAVDDWNAQVLAHVTLTQCPQTEVTEPKVLDDLVKQQRHLSHVAWSPWNAHGESQLSVIVYATNEDVRARVVNYYRGHFTFGDEVVYSDMKMRYSGLMKLSPIVERGNLLTLALFTDTNLVYLKVSMQNAHIVERRTHDLDGRWDPISGAVWDLAQPQKPRLHFSSLISTIHNSTAVLEISAEGLQVLGAPSWRDQVENSAVLFSAKNDLRGNSKVKVWGLAASPLGDFIATCTSVHPSDMIEYGSPNDRRGTIAVSALRQYQQSHSSLPMWDISAEGLLFSLKKLAENTVEKSDHIPAFIEHMIERLAQEYGAMSTTYDTDSTPHYSTQSDTTAIGVLVRKWKRLAFFEPHSLRDRYTIIVSYACNYEGSNDLPRTLIAYRLAMASQSMWTTCMQSDFSAEIMAHHRQMIRLIKALIDPTVKEGAPYAHNPEITEKASLAHTSLQGKIEESYKIPMDVTDCATDICDFCTAPIPFTNLTSATCLNGHQFPRCGLSFLAIQAPGITKYCGICSTPYLNQNFVAAQEDNGQTSMAVDNSRLSIKDIPSDTLRGPNNDEDVLTGDANNLQSSEVSDDAQKRNDGNLESFDSPQDTEEQGASEQKTSPVALAKLLFLACDVCIYCGGKFIGS